MNSLAVAILNQGSLTVSNSTVSGNATQLHGGGIWTSGQCVISNSTMSGKSGMNGGAINNRLGTLEIESTILNRGDSGTNIINDGTVMSHGYNLSSDDAGGYLMAQAIALTQILWLGRCKIMAARH